MNKKIPICDIYEDKVWYKQGKYIETRKNPIFVVHEVKERPKEYIKTEKDRYYPWIVLFKTTDKKKAEEFVLQKCALRVRVWPEDKCPSSQIP